MDSDQLRETIAQAQAGSAAAYELLLGDYGGRLYGYFYRATGHHHEAEDLLSELTFRLVRTLKKYDDRGRFESWLFRIAANMVRDRIRRRKIRPRKVSLSIENDQGQSLAAKLPANGPDVDTGLIAAERSRELRVGLEKLDETTRQMILLRHFGDMSFKEIAHQFNCPLGTALARVHRGLKKLRSFLEADGENPKE